ncbi:hypothetical protein AB0A76_31425 [Streptomyces exfoliatus]|uniref:Uncharacterized protein n=1 Tax=Streptomyces exfoliatus TaxID=1905 RepID=A0ABV3D5D5_STREX
MATKGLRFAAASLAAVAAGAWAVEGEGVGAETPKQLEVIELKVQNDQYTAADLGPVGPSLGDMDVHSGTAVKDGHSVGRGGGHCQVIHLKG